MTEVTNIFENIREVRECGQRWASHFLAHGYVLLDVQTGSRSARHPNEGTQHQGAAQWYVRRNPVFVLGRPEGVESVDPPPNI